MDDLRSRQGNPILEFAPYAPSTPVEGAYSSEVPPLPISDDLEVVFCLPLAEWGKIRSALQSGLAAFWPDEYYPLVAHLNRAEQDALTCGGERAMYRQNGCDLERSIDGGQTWVLVPNANPDGCEPDDLREPIFVATRIDDRVEFYWKFVDEGDEAYRFIGSVFDGRTPTIELDSIGDGCYNVFARYAPDDRRFIQELCFPRGEKGDKGDDGDDGKTPIIEARKEGQRQALYWRYASDPPAARKFLVDVPVFVPEDESVTKSRRACAGAKYLMEWLQGWVNPGLDFIDSYGLFDTTGVLTPTRFDLYKADASGHVIRYFRGAGLSPLIPAPVFGGGGNPGDSCIDPERDTSPDYSDEQRWVCEWFQSNAGFGNWWGEGLTPANTPGAAPPSEEDQRASLTRRGWEVARDRIAAFMASRPSLEIGAFEYGVIANLITNSGYGIAGASFPLLVYRLAGREVVDTVFQKGTCNTDCSCFDVGSGNDWSATLTINPGVINDTAPAYIFPNPPPKPFKLIPVEFVLDITGVLSGSPGEFTIAGEVGAGVPIWPTFPPNPPFNFPGTGAPYFVPEAGDGIGAAGGLAIDIPQWSSGRVIIERQLAIDPFGDVNLSGFKRFIGSGALSNVTFTNDLEVTITGV